MEFILKVSASEKVFVLVADVATREKLSLKLGKAGVNASRVEWILQRTNRSWMRDSGPIVVRHSSGLRLRGKIPDTVFPFASMVGQNTPTIVWIPRFPVVAQHLNLPMIEPMHRGRRVVLEGGSIDVNGKGTL